MEFVSERYLNFASVIDEPTREQNRMTSTMPFIYPHFVSMPDAHLGKGCAVGSVLPTLGAIIPAVVGVDIGCGMVAVRTGHSAPDIRHLDRRALREAIERAVPLSAENNNRNVMATAEPRIRLLEQEAADAGFNYTAKETHFGRDVWLSRKGAIAADEGRPGLIPGSMGTRSYVVTGKGFAPSLNSAPRGAGREYSQRGAEAFHP